MICSSNESRFVLRIYLSLQSHKEPSYGWNYLLDRVPKQEHTGIFAFWSQCSDIPSFTYPDTFRSRFILSANPGCHVVWLRLHCACKKMLPRNRSGICNWNHCPQCLDPDLTDTVCDRGIEYTPRDFAYFRARWSCEILSEILKERDQTSCTAETVSRWMRRLGFV